MNNNEKYYVYLIVCIFVVYNVFIYSVVMRNNKPLYPTRHELMHEVETLRSEVTFLEGKYKK